MKKYILEPYFEQTYSSRIDQGITNQTIVTRIATGSYGINSKDPVNDSILLSGNINTGINDANSQISTNVLINGQPVPIATTNYYSRNVQPANNSLNLYPIGTDNKPEIKSYNIAPTESPFKLPVINDNSFTYFIIGVVVILIILIIVYFFIL
uniref:Uncharacterized protein n=1 Tax=viral metagenome TaxID=1070528 RepID=A0A6C0HUV4_9ZZZZ